MQMSWDVSRLLAEARAVLRHRRVARWHDTLATRVVLFAVLFSAFTKVLGKLSGIGTTVSFFRLELPLVVLAFLGFYFLLRDSRYRIVIAALPLVVAYIAHDIYYTWYGTVFRLADLTELPELVNVLTLHDVALYSLVVVLPLMVVVWFINWPRGLVAALTLLFLLSVVPAAHGRLAASLVLGVETFGRITEWSDQYSTRDTGRLTMVLYQEAKRRVVMRQLAAARDNGPYRALVGGRSASLHNYALRRNVHVIVLESFLDPTLLDAVQYSPSPVHPDFAALFGGKEGLTISPVFGGKTCQAEFEALCGVPAFARLGSIEFNVLNGREVKCLPALLKGEGYVTIASNAYKPDFFNTLSAYKSLGFDEVYFPREYAPKRETYLSTGDVSNETFMFDGRLLSQNLAFVRDRICRRGGPLFNYVLGIYGHNPHTVDERARPRMINVYGPAAADHKLARYANQYYYRTAAVAAYLKGLMALDPDALIIVVSDHLPPLSDGPASYAQLNYLHGIEGAVYYNRLYIMENAGARQYSHMADYDIPDVVVNYLTGGEHCRLNHCNFAGQRRTRDSYAQAYMGLLAEEVR